MAWGGIGRSSFNKIVESPEYHFSQKWVRAGHCQNGLPHCLTRQTKAKQVLHPQVRLSHLVVVQHFVAFSFQCDLPILQDISSLT